MKIINLQQNTDEWLLYRQDKIGASDFCSFMYSCVNQSQNKIMDALNSIYDKKYTPVKDNTFMMRGRKMEPIIKSWIENNCKDITNGEQIQSIMVECDVNNRIVASLDGYCDFFGEQAIFEIKTTKIIEKIKQSQLINKYLYQLVHQYYTTYGNTSNRDAYLIMCIKADIYSNEEAKIDILQLSNKNESFLLEYIKQDNVLSWGLEMSYQDWLKICDLYLSAIDKKLNMGLVVEFINRYGVKVK